MSLSFAGGHRTPSAGSVIVNPGPAVLGHSPPGIVSSGSTSSGLASSGSSPVSAAPVLAAPVPVLATPVVPPLVQAVERRLRESSYYYLRSIRCSFEAGAITLRGRVPTFYLKQTVQSIVEKIEGVEQIVNLVDVFDSRQDVPSAIRRTA